MTNSSPMITIAGRQLQTTAAFDTYWRFAADRQDIYEARLAGLPEPWSPDPILRQHRFTNCYRAADRVSQYLIRSVIYGNDYSPEDIVFRVLLFKMFNKVSTWELLEDEFGEITFDNFTIERYDKLLTHAMFIGQRLYSPAYIIPPPQLGAERKHTNHLRLIDLMMHSNIADKIRSASTMQEVYGILLDYPSMGPFLAFQALIDLNYSTVIDFSEMEFVVAGPGACNGVRKCFGPESRGIEENIIRYMAHYQDDYFKHLGLTFNGLRGRPLYLIDCQNLFCEVDKYCRVAHPEIPGASNRTKIKQRFTPVKEPVTAWFPPKWGINED